MARASARSKRSVSTRYPPAAISIAPPAKSQRTGQKVASHRTKIDPALDPDLYATAVLSTGLGHLAAGKFPEALLALQSSLDFQVAMYGADHPASIDIRVHLSQVLRRLDRRDAAREMIEAAVMRARAGRGASTVQLGLALCELAELELELSSLLSAQPEAEQSQQLLESAGDARRSMPMDVMARIHLARGDFAAAVELYQAILSIDAGTYLGTQHPRYLRHSQGYAMALLGLGQLAAATKLLKRVIESLEQLYGDEHPDLVTAYLSVGSIEQSRKRFDEAAAYYEKARRLASQSLSKTHSSYGLSLASLGLLYLERDDPKSAQRLLRESVAIYHKALPRPHPWAASALTYLAYVLVETGQLEEARVVADEAINLWQMIASLHSEVGGAVGSCDLAFAFTVRDVASAALEEEAFVDGGGREALLEERLPNTDIRRRLLQALIQQGLIRTSQEQTIIVEVWLSGNLSPSEQKYLRQSLEGLLAQSADASLVAEHLAVAGSFYQKFVFAVKFFSQYGARIIANLRSALGATADAQQVAVIERLSSILKDHESIAIRMENIIAIKVTRNRKPHVFIDALPDEVRVQLAREPGLIRQPEALYKLIAKSA